MILSAALFMIGYGCLRFTAEWFREPDFRGCIFINSALETAERDNPVSRACLGVGVGDARRRLPVDV